MLDRPSHTPPLRLDVRDPDFPAQCIALTNQMRSEMRELVASHTARDRHVQNSHGRY
jgi:hypothetical protein